MTKDTENKHALRTEAIKLTKEVSDLDTQIKTLTDQRAAVQKQLRSIKNKIVTIDINESLVA